METLSATTKATVEFEWSQWKKSLDGKWSIM